MDSISKQSVEPGEVFNENKLSSIQYIMLALCFSVMLLDGYDTAIMAFVAPVISKSWGIVPAALRMVLSAALFGVAFGALLAGPLADRFGRKAVLVGSVLFFGVWGLSSAWAADLTSLAWFRFLTGLGLGAAMPNAATLTAEYSPARSRATMVAFLFCGFTLGSAGGGLLSSVIIPRFGWESTFVVGGVMPIALSALMLIYLPESIQYLSLRGHNAKAFDILRRIEKRFSIGPDAAIVLPEQRGAACGSPVAALFHSGMLPGTFALWLTYFLGLLVIFLLRSWLPTLVTLSGQTISRAAFLGAMFDVGGTFGALMISRLVDRLKSDQVVPATYLTAGGTIAIFAQYSSHVSVLALGIFLLGFLLSGAQACVPALAAKFYPTAVRATGVAWVLGIGRFGGIAGALTGGSLLGLGWDLSAILMSLTAPAMLATLVIWAHIRRVKAKGLASPDFVLA